MNFSALATSIAAIQNIGLDSPKHSFTYMNFACSGAEIGAGAVDSSNGGLLHLYDGRETVAQLKFLQDKFRQDLHIDEQPSDLPAQVSQLENNLCPNSPFPLPNSAGPTT